ncbi:MAG: sugar nucleotide-binding protein, partial [Candidatus Eremiobacteraeota bacterium]|nr:sugar nucleotide-binding protein [Candidatus Eremiobacteraeota bacterium]
MSEKPKLFVIGANGQFGSAIMFAAQAQAFNSVGLSHAECEVTDPVAVERALETAGPADTVINTAAFHKTDACEDAPQRALAVNALGASYVASVARARGARVVYVSSDYVFDGAK